MKEDIKTSGCLPGKYKRTSKDSNSLYRAVLDNIFCVRGKFPEVATINDFYQAFASTVKEEMLYRWICTARRYFEKASRTVVYISAEYLPGPQLGYNLFILGWLKNAEAVARRFRVSLDELLEYEEEPGLGHGGLGRLAACILESLAKREIPAIGYGLRYEFGIFDQEFRDGWQVEVPDKWLRMGNPWELSHPELTYMVPMGGYTEHYHDEQGRFRVRWVPSRLVCGTPFDIPVPGYGVNTVNILRLWNAEASESLDLQAFNAGDYYRAVEKKVECENITRVLYPNDKSVAGRKLRLEQEYFLVSCTLQDMIRIYRQREKSMAKFHIKYAVQLNDTHPVLAIAELMRLLVDEYLMDWDTAWLITTRTFAYTNHTLLSEALERWEVSLFRAVLPRHLEIIYEINRRFLDTVRIMFPKDSERIRRLSLIDEEGEKYVRMANLACIGSFSINGVSKIHTSLMKSEVFKDFYEIYPEKFVNITNGVSHRRFLVFSNPLLADLISRYIGTKWVGEFEEIRKLEKYVDDEHFLREWHKVKLQNKEKLICFIKKTLDIDVDSEMLFDVHVKRIHEYKRQLLKILHVLTLYNKIKKGDVRGVVPRAVIFSGKASAGYTMAKLIIKLINSVAEKVNNSPETVHLLRVIFIPDFNVKNAQRIYPSAELSEQISTAGMEASGTGNMKMTINGALTIGTYDGANLEIAQAVGKDNIFLFGLTAEEVHRIKREGYIPRKFYETDPQLREIIDMIASGEFSGGDRSLFQPLVEQLLQRDEFMVLADYASYISTQSRVEQIYLNKKEWLKKSVLNVARSGYFSSDRTVREYCEKIWRVKPVRINL
jgi:starch phosphorylase